MKYALILLTFSTVLWSQIPPRNRPGYCPLQRSYKCFDFVAERVSKWEVDDEYEVVSLVNACAGNIGDTCLSLAEKHLPWYAMNDIDDLKVVARGCKLTNVACMEYLIPRLSRWDYNKVESFRELAMACARVTDLTCIERRCDLRAYNCNRSEDLFRAAKSCYTPCYKKK